jgi:hypothetical protein
LPENTLVPCLYFERPGPANTETLLDHAARRAGELGIEKVVIASASGRTALAALERFDPQRFGLISVSHVTGFREPDDQELPDRVKAELREKGVRVLTAAHAFGGVGRGVRNKLGSFQVDEIMAFALRTLGQGVKVGVEISLMAADRGWVRTDEEIMTIAGTGRGADTALIVKPAHSAHCLEAKVKEIVAKPRNP